MVSCKSCGSPISPPDGHTLCIVHRKCSRKSPCPLDKDMDAHFWSEVESIRAASRGVRTVKRPTKEKGKDGKQGEKFKGAHGSLDMPILSPMSNKRSSTITTEG